MGERNHFKIWLILSLILMLFLWDAGAVFPAGAGAKDSVVSKPVDRYAIGCVLPLSGQNAAAGNRALDAIVLASGVFDPVVKTPIKLVIEDSQSRPETARAAVAKLATQDGVICILGPLGADESLDAAREAQRLKVPIISLAEREGITDTGNYVFRSYLTNRVQIVSLVKYVIQEMGLARFAVLYPEDNYGRDMEKLFREEVLRRKGEILKVTSYQTTKTDFADEIKSLSDFKEHLRAGKEGEGPGDGDKPDIGFDALFIPDTPARISMIVPQLAFHDVRGVRLLGTSDWDTPEILKAGGELLEGAIFVDAFSPNSFYPEVNDFTDLYYTNYSREPDAVEALAYDAAGIIVKILSEDGVKTRDQFRKNLLDVRDYRGVTGRTSFSGMRDARKDVFVLTIKDGKIIQIK
ncbi:MAG: penicillin-binding protein activator [Syntrophales bacterium]|jgi:ABC-type branched-subunit amino acid transport system substrate-binding protein